MVHVNNDHLAQLNKEDQIREKIALLKFFQNSSKFYQKKNNQIENSKLWKFSKRFSFFFRLRHRLKLIFNSKKNNQEKLELEAKHIQLELLIDNLRISDEMADISKELIDLNREKQKDYLRMLNKQGKLLTFVNDMANYKQSHEKMVFEIMKLSAQAMHGNQDEDVLSHFYKQIIKAYSMAPVPDYMVRYPLENDLELSMFDSFSNQLVIKERKKQFGQILPEQLLDNKKIAYQFVERLNIDYPKQTGDFYTYMTIPKQEGIVIKPADGAGSRGVYLIYHFTKILDVKRKKTLTSWQQLLESMESDLAQNRVHEDQWFTEQLLLRDKANHLPAKDLKFYTFYGKAALILEIERHPELRYCWWDHSGNRISTGKYDNDLFIGEGVTAEDIEMAEKISREIPTPFMRIDFLKAEDALYFGEFTPKPGNFDEFNKSTDEWLGKLYLEAEVELNQDLIAGKNFGLYRDIMNK